MNIFWRVKTLAAAMFAVIMIAVSAMAQDLPKIAVYVTGDVSDNEKKALGTQMLASLVNIGRYKGIERSNSFLAEIEKEQTKQRSGDIDDNQISALGRQFGVKFVCIADITPAFGEFQVSARIVDVETAQVEFIGASSGTLKSMTDLEKMSEQVVKNMFGGEAAQSAKPAKKTTPVQSSNSDIQQTETKINADDFTAGQRWGTWALNVVPGLGSFVIMKDNLGGGVNLALGGAGIIMTVIWAGTVDRFDNAYILGFSGVVLWLGAGSIWNTYRSITYHKPVSRSASAVSPENFGFAVLPDRDGNLKGYAVLTLTY